MLEQVAARRASARASSTGPTTLFCTALAAAGLGWACFRRWRGDSIRCASPAWRHPSPSGTCRHCCAEDRRADPSWRRRSRRCGPGWAEAPRSTVPPLPRAGGGVREPQRAVRLTLTRFPALALGLVAGLDGCCPGPGAESCSAGELIVRFAPGGRPRAGGDPRACGGRLRQQATRARRPASARGDRAGAEHRGRRAGA